MPAPLPARVYSDYRKSVRSLRHRSAAMHRRQALHLTADRHLMPVADVEAIVCGYETPNGIVHEHPYSPIQANCA